MNGRELEDWLLFRAIKAKDEDGDWELCDRLRDAAHLLNLQRRIASHVPARIAIEAKEKAGFGEAIKTK